MGAVESGAGLDERRAAGAAFMHALSRREPDDLNKIHVPDDAGIHRDGLIRIMTRIPDGWGRWISCSRGWYPLICRLDADLSALDSGYVVKQCKEKFGVLKYYYCPSRDGVAEQMNELIRAAYAESAVTCELCGEPGTLHRSRIGWATTLCGHCALASDRGYRPANETVQELTPDLPGIWKVTTGGSTHTWDLSRMEYTRRPGPHSGGRAMPSDQQAHPIVRVVQWPRVGGRSHVEFDRGMTVEWRISSAIIEIRRVR